MRAFIYTLSDPRTGEVRYVGKTSNPDQRKRAHGNVARDKQTYKRNWINKLREEGLKPVFEIIDEVPISEWKFWEKYWICQFRAWGFRLCNIGGGGEGASFGNRTSFQPGHGSKGVVGYNLQGERAYRFDSGEQASRFFNIHRSVIPQCCNRGCKKVKGLVWYYEEWIQNLSHEALLIDIERRYQHSPIISSTQFKKGCDGMRSKRVTLYDTYLNSSRQFSSATKAAASIGMSAGSVTLSARNNTLIKKRYKVEYA